MRTLAKSLAGVLCTSATLALSTSISHAATQSMLLNGGFESGVATNSTIATDWSVLGNTARVTGSSFGSPFAQEGTWAMRLKGGPSAGSISTVYEQFSTREGDVWRLTGYGLNSSSAPMAAADAMYGVYAYLGISFYDTGLNQIGDTSFSTATLDDTTPANQWMPLDTGYITAPAGAAYARLQANYEDGTVTSAVFLDGMVGTMNPIPEPSSLAFVGLGLLSFTLWAKRRAASN